MDIEYYECGEIKWHVIGESLSGLTLLDVIIQREDADALIEITSLLFSLGLKYL